MTKFYISDTHFGHEKIIKLANRPFKSVSEMDDVLIKNWNSVVHEDDIVYHLGDFAWKSQKHYLEQLNGNIIFLEGNHDLGMAEAIDDRRIDRIMKIQNNNLGFKIITNYKKYDEIQDFSQNLRKIKIVLFHYPILEWNGMFKGWFHFYGHVHNELKHDNRMSINWKARAFDVGVEALDYFPRTAEEIIMKGNR